MNTFSNRLATALLVLTLGLVALPSASAGHFKRIVIDGDFTDWAGVPIAYSDPTEEGAAAGTDFKDVWIAHDSDYVYVRVSLYNTNTLSRPQNNFFVNGDGDFTTGFGIRGTGSEMLVQNGTAYQEKNGTFNDGSLIQELNWAVAPAGSASQFECRFSRHAKYEDGGDVFTSDAIAILLETENQNYTEVDTAKDDAPIDYLLDPAPAPATGPAELISLTGTSWRFERSGTDLGDGWADPAFDDTQGNWESGSGLFGRTPSPNAYPAPIATPLTDNHVTHYFRARFSWDKDTAGLSLIASNLLSDGAVFYLNGAEIGRSRLPAGPVGFSAPATGPNPASGAFEVLDLPSNALLVGENVLAVEVHQSAGDTGDLVFGLALFATDRLPASITSPLVPQSVDVEEGTSLTLTVTARGTEPLTYQWFKAGVPIPEATNRTYAVSAASQGDAGAYTVQVSNGSAQGVASPVFTVATHAVPVTITDPNLPQNAAVLAGSPITFNLQVAGSPPIVFQWYKDGVSIPEATNQSYTLPAVLPSQAGLYTCVVSNRVTPPLTSRSATLTVIQDAISPTLLTVTGGGNHAALQFSEPIDPASVTAGQFVISPTITVSAAALSPDDEARVILTTATLTPGALYTLQAANLRDRFGNVLAAGTTKQFRATILIDGDFTDWEGVPVSHSDPEDAGLETGAQADLKDIWITSDNSYLYIRFSLWRPGEPFNSYNNIFIDADNDPATGYTFNGLGSELLLQGGNGYEQKSGIFNDGGVSGLDWLAASDTAGTEFEVRLARSVVFVDADAGGPVFKGEAIALVLESENTGYVAQEMAPDSGSGPIAHTLLNYESTELGALLAVRTGGTVTISWSGPGKLQSIGTLSAGAWQDVTNATSPYAANPADPQRYYRLVSP